MPPLRLSTRLNPTDRRKSAALALRPPILHCTTISVVRVELGVTPRDIAERDQLRPGDAVDLVFVRLADVDDAQLVAAVEALLQLDRRDLQSLLICATAAGSGAAGAMPQNCS